MEIVVNKREERYVNIEDIDIGEGFIYGDSYFIRMSNEDGAATNGDDTCYAMSIDRYAMLYCFEPYTKVRPIGNIKIIITE